ncbi:transcriptional Coactivator p15-domain-containing protein [Podospora aff. communis PSN243]|uniref:Transcriptional Coactivator p15-domain-containing protein n=1 Tax=Podospora aff. communis PSN243 TaxID=3040156 RepID=A0AAV9GUT7_9PEZI|nr:transcriptional Coactivator p15-domain-containing protein [Podospora aff. communis PSN243]
MGKRAAESDGEDIASPNLKKAKASSSKTHKTPKAKADPAPPSAASGTDAEGNSFWQIGGTRRVTISKFKGTTLISIREYYTDKASGEAKPTKKGISLSVEQFQGLVDAMPSLVQALEEDGHELSLPDTGNGGAPIAEASEKPEKPKKAKKSKKSDKPEKPKKSNIEETSEEEDDEEGSDEE